MRADQSCKIHVAETELLREYVGRIQIIMNRLILILQRARVILG